MLASKFISVNNIISLILVLFLITGLVFAYFYLLKPIFLPSSDHFLLTAKELQIKKELFQEVVAELEKRPQKAQKALEKWHPDPFRL